MKLLKNILFVEFDEAVESGFSDRTIKSWKEPLKIANPEDRRAKLINYELLKQRYKDMILSKYGNPYTYYWQNQIERLIRFDNESYLSLRTHKVNGTGLPDEHIKQYTKCCNVLSFLAEMTPKKAKQSGFDSMATLYEAVATYIKSNNVSLPSSYAKLKAKLKEFKNVGFKAVVSGKFGNTNTKKIDGEIEDWILSTYCLPTKPDTAKVHALYLNKAVQKGWPTLSETGIYSYLHRTDVRPMWYLSRHGEKEWTKEYGHTMKLFIPTYRDAMWAVDGTKLNFYYYTEDNALKMASQLKMTIVSDVYSDSILGMSIDFTEDHVTAYQSLKDACKFSGHKPYQIKYDNQAGFKKSETQGLMTQLSKVHFPAKPYNPQSKKVESVIGRFQKQVMSDYWFFTGQNITAKSVDSKANMDFILKNKDMLPTEAQIRELMLELQEKWNNSIQKKYTSEGKTRIERYLNSEAPEPMPITMIDMVDSFWLERSRPITYYAHGIKLSNVGGKDYEFEVYERDGVTPSADFHCKYIKKKFTVRYDPEDLSHVRLYDPTDGRFIAVAENKNEYAEFVGDLTEGMRADIDENMRFRKDRKEWSKRKAKEAADRSGVDPQTLVEVGYKSDMKEAMNAGETALQLTEAMQGMSEEEIRRIAIDRL